MAEKNCDGLETIEEVTDQWDYVDTNPGGSSDSDKVSCGQDVESSGYNELKDKFNKYYTGYDESDVAEAMCECCKEKGSDSSYSWDDFYECMEEKGFKKYGSK